MIIRRADRTTYTVIANAAVEDSLSYEALGLLTYLLSRPDDWEVRIDQLRQRVKIGRDKIYRIVKELALAGYLKHERIYEDGKVASGRWIVREQAEREQDSTPEALAELDPEKPDEGVDLRPENLRPENLRPGKPDEYQRLTVTKDSQPTKVEREGAREAQKKPDDDLDFQKLLKRYTGTNSPNLAFPPWLRLDDEGRRRALARLEAYQADLRKARRDAPYSLQRYLSERLFDQVDEPADGKPVQTTVRPRTDEWWALFWRRRKVGERVNVMLDQAKGDGAWGCALDGLPDAAEIGALAEIEVGSEAFRAWSTHLARDGLRLGGEACGKFIRVPTEFPPGQGTGTGKRSGLGERWIDDGAAADADGEGR